MAFVLPGPVRRTRNRTLRLQVKSHTSGEIGAVFRRADQGHVLPPDHGCRRMHDDSTAKGLFRFGAGSPGRPGTEPVDPRIADCTHATLAGTNRPARSSVVRRRLTKTSLPARDDWIRGDAGAPLRVPPR